MSRHLVTVTSEMSVEDAARSMLTNKVSCLPVVDAQSRPIGVVTWRDLVRAFLSGP